DGIVEAIEDPAQSFCLGILWHPDEDAVGGGLPIFRGLVEAAREYAARRGYTCTSIRPSTTRTGYVFTGSAAGPSSTAPVRTSNSEPWQLQTSAAPFSQPSLSGHSSCVHSSASAYQSPPTRARTRYSLPTLVARSSPSSPSAEPTAVHSLTRPSLLQVVGVLAG